MYLTLNKLLTYYFGKNSFKECFFFFFHSNSNFLTPELNDGISFSPLNLSSDQHQISPCNANDYPTPEVMRIHDMIAQGEYS